MRRPFHTNIIIIYLFSMKVALYDCNIHHIHTYVFITSFFYCYNCLLLLNQGPWSYVATIGIRQNHFKLLQNVLWEMEKRQICFEWAFFVIHQFKKFRAFASSFFIWLRRLALRKKQFITLLSVSPLLLVLSCIHFSPPISQQTIHFGIA